MVGFFKNEISTFGVWFCQVVENGKNWVFIESDDSNGNGVWIFG